MTDPYEDDVWPLPRYSGSSKVNATWHGAAQISTETASDDGSGLPTRQGAREALVEQLADLRALLAPSPAEGTGEAVCCGDHDEDGGRPCNGCPERAPEPAPEGGALIDGHYPRCNSRCIGDVHWLHPAPVSSGKSCGHHPDLLCECGVFPERDQRGRGLEPRGRVVMPGDQADEIGAPQLCPFCIERLRRATEHGHVDEEWAARASGDFARQCCTDRTRSLR